MSIADFEEQTLDQDNDRPLLSNEDRALIMNMVENEFYYRRQMLDKLEHPNRNVDKECGYAATSDLNAEVFLDLFERFPIATRVITLPVRESWRVTPDVYETENEEEETIFELAWQELQKKLRGEESFFKDQLGSPIWEHLERVDMLSRIGHYGSLLLEFDDVGTENEDGELITWAHPAPNFSDEGYIPADYTSNKVEEVVDKAVDEETDKETTVEEKEDTEEKDGKEKKKGFKPEVELVGLRCLDETHAWISEWDTDPRSKNYGRPKTYMLRLSDNDYIGYRGSINSSHQTDVSVHWSRIIHIADGMTWSEYIGTPACRPVANDLLDLKKIYAASGEGYWRVAFPALFFETHPQLGPKINLDIVKTQDAMAKLRNSLQRELALVGGTVKTLSGSVQDPTPNVEVRIEAICIYLGCPVRIFKGSERGELASSQDKDSWDERMVFRQLNHITPRIIVPFIDRLIRVGVLPKPAEGYSVQWPDITTLSRQAKLEIAVAFVDATSKYIAGGVESLITPIFFLTKILDFTQEEAEEILEAAEERAAEMKEEQAAEQEEALKQQMEAGAIPSGVGPNGKPLPPGQPPTGSPPVPGEPAFGKPQAQPIVPGQPPKSVPPGLKGAPNGQPKGNPTQATPPKAQGAKEETDEGGKKPTKNEKSTDRLLEVNSSVCGASGGPGRPGFQKGNKCAAGNGVSGVATVSSLKVGDEVWSPKYGEWKTIHKIYKGAFDSTYDYDETGYEDENLDHLLTVETKQKKVSTKSVRMPNQSAAEKFEYVSSLGGSTGATLVRDPVTKEKFVKKYGANEGHIVNEFNADQLYRAAGINVPDSELYKDASGKVYKLSRYLEDAKPLSELTGVERDIAIKQLHKEFAIDATLANWDVIGISEDNIMVKPNPNGAGVLTYRIDNGGALKYRAKGAEKYDLWNDNNDEVNTMRTSIKNISAKNIYGSMTDAQVAESFAAYADKLQPMVDAAVGTEMKSRIASRFANGSNKVVGKVTASPVVHPVFSSGASLKSIAVNAYVGDAKYTTAHQKKLEALNPNGIVDGTIHIPLISGSPTSPKNQALIAKYKQLLPSGTKVLGVSVTKLTEAKQKGQELKKSNPTKVGSVKSTPTVPEPAPYTYKDTAGSKTIKPGVLKDKGIEVGTKFELDKDIPPLTQAEQDHLRKLVLQTHTKSEATAFSSWKGSAMSYRTAIAGGMTTLTEETVPILTGQAKLPKFEGVVYRGYKGEYGKIHSEQIKQLGVGGFWIEHAPACSSRNSYTGVHFSDGKVLLKVKTKTGGYLGDAYGYEHEEEVVLSPTKAYKITRIVENADVVGVDRNGKKHTPTNIQLYVEMEEV